MKRKEGDIIEVMGWEGQYADVLVYSADMTKPPIRKLVPIETLPKNLRKTGEKILKDFASFERMGERMTATLTRSE